MEQDVFTFLFAVWILKCRLHLGEDPQVVQPLLALGDAALGNRVARRYRDSAGHQRRLGGFQAAHQSASDVLAFSRNHPVAKVHPIGGRRGILAALKLRVGITVVVVVAQNRVPVGCDVGRAVRLPFGGSHNRAQIRFVFRRNSLDRQPVHQPLRALVYLNVHRQVAALTAVVVLDRRMRHHHVGEIRWPCTGRRCFPHPAAAAVPNRARTAAAAKLAVCRYIRSRKVSASK